MNNPATDSLNARVAQLAQTWKSRDKALGDTAEDLCHALTPILMKLDLLASVAELPVDMRPNWVVSELTDLRGQAENCVQRSVAAIRAARVPAMQPPQACPVHQRGTVAPDDGDPEQSGYQNLCDCSAAMASGGASSDRAPANADRPDDDAPPSPATAVELAALRQTVLDMAEELTEPLTVVVNYLMASRSLLHRVDPAVSGQMQYAIEEAYAQASRAGAIVKRLRRSVLADKVR